MKRALLKTMLTGGAFAPFRLANGRSGLVLMYHRFSKQDDPDAVSASEFAEHLRYLTRHYTIVSLPVMVEQLSATTMLARSLAAITIDDGHADAYDIAFPVLKRFGVPATLFVVTGFLDQTCWLWTDRVRYVITHTTATPARIATCAELLDVRIDQARNRVAIAALMTDRLKQMPEDVKHRALELLDNTFDVDVPMSPPPRYAPVTWEQAREMDRNGVAVESHTVTHPILTNVSHDQLVHEVTESKRRLEEELGHQATAFCYPNGNWNPTVCQTVRRAGYKCAVTTTSGFNQRGIDPFGLRRLGAEADMARFVKATSGFELWQTGVWRARQARPS